MGLHDKCCFPWRQCLHVNLLLSFLLCPWIFSWIFIRCYLVQPDISPTGLFSIFKLNTVLSNFPSSEYSTKVSLSFFLSWVQDKPLTWRGRANYSMCASNWKAAVELSNLWFSEWSLSTLREKNATQYWWEEKKSHFLACLRDQTRSELPFGHTVDCEISAIKKSQF